MRALFIAVVALTAALTAGIAGAARAHDADYALTSVAWNADAGSLEVIHRIHTHQAFDAAASTAGNDAPATFNGTKSLAALGLYVEKRFELTDGAGAPIPLEFVGAEIEGDYVLVYQEAARDAPPATIRVRNDILADLRPRQINHVNVMLDGPKRTLVFNEDRRGAFLTPKADAKTTE
ncbi:MAG: DUF6702 family protein [Pseudomonadota bacterium]